MAVTIKHIAEKAGVSRGTVDRALNFRKDINPQQAERIRKIAEEMGYQPNRMGRTLALSKKRIKIGVLVQPSSTPFFKQLLQGAYAAKEEMNHFYVDVIIKEAEEMGTDLKIKAMRELREEGCTGIAVIAIEDERFREIVTEFTQDGIPIVTMNADISDSERMCFVGQDGWQSGRTAAGLMAEILPKDAKVLIISGYAENTSNSRRVEGFLNEIEKIRPDIKEISLKYAHESAELSADIAKEAINHDQNLKGIYCTAAGVRGVCRALEELDMVEDIKLISNDITDENVIELRKGIINFLIGQDAYSQGYQPVKILFEKLVEKKTPEKKEIFTNIEIKSKYNA